MSAQSFDYVLKSRYTVLIQSTDKGGLKTTKSFQIEVENINTAPTQLLISATELNENEPSGSVVGSLSTVDEDEDDTHTYKLISGAGSRDNGRFSIVGNDLVSKDVFDFEKNTEFTIRVQTTDNAGNSFEQDFVITVIDVNEAPTAFDAEMNVSEDATIGLQLGTIDAIDTDQNQQFTFKLVKSEASSLFQINTLSGEVTLNTSKLNYETQKVYDLLVIVSDNGVPSLSDTVSLVINVTDQIEGFLPSVDYMSPNGDGKNDTWIIENVSLYEDYKLIIYSAFGIEVFSVNSGYDNTWNGTYQGNELPRGTYYYVLIDNNDNNNVFKGTISLVR